MRGGGFSTLPIKLQEEEVNNDYKCRKFGQEV